MDSGPQHLSGGVPRTGSHLWTNAGGNGRRASLALCQRGRDATNERDAVRGGERCLSSRGPCAGRLFSATAGHRYHVYGVAGGGCRSIREFSPGNGGLREKPATLRSHQSESRHLERALSGISSMIRTTIRLLTATAVIVMSGIAVAQGWDIVRFFLAGMNIVSSEKRAVFADALRARSGIISTALLDDLDDEANR